MRLYIIRHADPDYPNNTLTAAGRLEAQALARRLASHGLDYVYHSPIARARETMQYTVDLLKLDPVEEHWTKEIDVWPWQPEADDPDDWIPAWDIPGEIIRGLDPVPGHVDWYDVPPLNRPVYHEFYEQFRGMTDELIKRHGYERVGGRYRIVQPNRHRIAIFCHNGTALALLAHFLELPLPLVWTGFWHAPSAVTTILFEERSADWAVPRAISVGDVSHLYEARLPVQPRGMRANIE